MTDDPTSVSGIVPAISRQRDQRPSGMGIRLVMDRGEGGAPAEDEAFEQGIRGEAVGALHACAGHFARRIEAGQGRTAVNVGTNAAHAIVRSGGDGDEVAGEVKAVFGEAFTDAEESHLSRRGRGGAGSGRRGRRFSGGGRPRGPRHRGPGEG